MGTGSESDPPQEQQEEDDDEPLQLRGCSASLPLVPTWTQVYRAARETLREGDSYGSGQGLFSSGS